MKKMILVAIMFAAGYALSAQVTVAYKMPSSVPENTYIVPQTIRTNFQTAYPTASMVTWEPIDGWWSARHIVDNNSISVVTYSTQPYYLETGRDVNYLVALPVINSYVPDAVIASAITSYGSSLYSITTIKSANNDDVYQLALIEKGTVRTVWMNAESIAYTDTYKIRTTNEQ